MAGLGFKDFQVGEVLTSADVDGYLMQQTVMRFADSGARGSALGTAAGTGVPLAEGMVAYLDDANYVQVYNGAGWVSAVPGIGTNVVQTVKTNAFTTTSTSFTPVTDLAVTITPTSAASKVLVLAKVSLNARNTANALMRLLRDATPVFIGDAASARAQATSVFFATQFGAGDVLVQFVDAPATATAVTYKIEVATQSGTLAVNTSGNDTDAFANGRTVSSITAVEVAV